MSVTYGASGFISAKIRSCLIGVHGFFSYSKTSVSKIHLLQQFKHKKFVHPSKRKNTRSTKSSGETEDNNTKMYMRDTIGTISNILRFSTWDSAQEQLENLPIRWDSFTINQVLKTHPPMEKAWLFFNWASRLKRFKHDQFTYTTMLDIFGEAGRIPSMMYLFKQMQEKSIKIDVVTYTSILHWLSKDGDIEGSLKTWEEMKANGCPPTVVSYTAFMKVLFDNKRPKEATAVYKEMIESGCYPNCYTYTVLIEYLAGAGKFKEALEILSKMQEAGTQPDKATCNILVQKCSRAGETLAMAQTLQYMKENSLVLRHNIYMEALEALKLAGESDDLLREVNPHLSFEGIGDGRTSDNEVATKDSCFHSTDRGIVLNLLSRRNFVAVEHFLEGIMNYKNAQLDSALISAIVRANCENCRLPGAILAFKYSKITGIKFERAAYLSLIGLFIRTKSFENIMEIVEEMVSAGLALGTHLVSILIYRLGCAGMCSSSAKIFELLPDEQNTVTYTALIDAYMRFRHVNKALDLYGIMYRKGIQASSGTYAVLLTGLEGAGRFQEAEVFRQKMKSLKWNNHSKEIVSMEEKLCNLMFDTGRAL